MKKVRQPPKLSLCLNVRNEGGDVLQTIISVRNAYSGPFEAVVVDDASEDGCCDILRALESGHPWPDDIRCPSCGAPPDQLQYRWGSVLDDYVDSHGVPRDDAGGVSCANPGCDFSWSMFDDIIVIRNEKAVGCGRAKQMAVEAATGDVILHMDGHCRVLRGTLDGMVQKCLEEPCVLAPGVAPLYTPKDQQAAPDEFYKGNKCNWGGVIEVVEKDKKGNPKPPHLRVNGAWKGKTDRRKRKAGDLYARRSATWYAIFMVGRETLMKRLGGWNQYPALWGSQELGFALRCWFADVPIYTALDVVTGHRYQADKHHKAYVKELTARGIRHYPTRGTAANHAYAVGMVFDDHTMEHLWEPIFREYYFHATKKDARYDGIVKRLEPSAYAEQRAHFQKHCKRRTDAEFFAEFGQNTQRELSVPADQPAPTIHAKATEPSAGSLDPSDVTAILLHYKRPVNMQRCVDALRAGGIEKIWLWNNGDEMPPEGITRLLTDSENSRTWPRWAIASLAETPYVLHIDDDAELKPAGIEALLRGAYPDGPVGLFGFKFKPPYNDYLKRDYYWCERIKADTEVDILYPKGLIWPRDLMQEVYGRADLWQEMRRQCGGKTRGDDFIAYVALSMMGHQPPVVMASEGRGVIEHVKSAFREDHGDCLSAQPEYKLKRKTMPVWRALGYEPIGLKEESKVAKPTFEERVAGYPKAGGGKIKQNLEELEEFFNQMNEINPSCFMEIGSEYGGSAYILAGACQPGARIVLVDKGTRHPARTHLKRTLAALQAEGYDAVWVRDDSHYGPTVKEAERQCQGRPVDALFIDGDHSEAGSEQDYRNYSRFVRPGGIIGLHDIIPERRGCYVSRFWRRLKKELAPEQTSEIVKGGVEWNKQKVLGIGVVTR